MRGRGRGRGRGGVISASKHCSGLLSSLDNIRIILYACLPPNLTPGRLIYRMEVCMRGGDERVRVGGEGEEEK